MRFHPASVQLRRAQLVLILSVLVPTVLLLAVGIVTLAVGQSKASHIVTGVLVLTFCGTAIIGYILGSILVGRGESLARAQSNFLTSVSHELRTPLTSIGLFLESLRDGRLAPEDHDRVLDLLGGEVGRMDRLVGRLLELSRLESGAHVFENAPVDVEELLIEARAAFDASALSRPTPIAIEVEPGLQVLGDRPTLVRAVLNLLMNAWKYTGDDKRIGVSAKAVAKSVEITVVDNGIGIPWHERQEIFGGFHRGEEAIRRGTPGVGLGLAFVRLIARAHKGSIDVSPATGGGSAFRLRLPAVRESA
jgi:two-component system, OmpR family, phosphate regulon sensor histidine kinase PhoR